jgi:hypothetical protein
MTPQDDEAMAAADKEMEERANRAKQLLSQRYQGLKTEQVRHRFVHHNYFPYLFHLSHLKRYCHNNSKGGKACSENAART